MAGCVEIPGVVAYEAFSDVPSPRLSPRPNFYVERFVGVVVTSLFVSVNR